jgi:hypothetical protein
MVAANKIVALLVLMIVCCSFYKTSAVNPELCALKDQVLKLCRGYLRVVPVPGPNPPPTQPTKDSRCCKKVGEVTEWKELMDRLTHDEERGHWMWRMRSLPGVCKINEYLSPLPLPPPPPPPPMYEYALFVIRKNNLLLAMHNNK